MDAGGVLLLVVLAVLVVWAGWAGRVVDESRAVVAAKLRVRGDGRDRIRLGFHALGLPLPLWPGYRVLTVVVPDDVLPDVNGWGEANRVAGRLAMAFGMEAGEPSHARRRWRWPLCRR